MVLKIVLHKSSSNSIQKNEIDKKALLSLFYIEEKFDDAMMYKFQFNDDEKKSKKRIKKNLEYLKKLVSFNSLCEHSCEIDMPQLHEELFNNLNDDSKISFYKHSQELLKAHIQKVKQFKLNVGNILSKTNLDLEDKSEEDIRDLDIIVLDGLLNESYNCIIKEEQKLYISKETLKGRCLELVRTLSWTTSEIKTSSYFKSIKEKLSNFSIISKKIIDLLNSLKSEQDIYSQEQYSDLSEKIKELIHYLKTNVENNLFKKEFTEYKKNVKSLLESLKDSDFVMRYGVEFANDVKYLCLQIIGINNILNAQNLITDSEELINLVCFLNEEMKNLTISTGETLIEKLQIKERRYTRKTLLEMESFDLITLQLRSLRSINSQLI
ncbi:hypothetical protein AB837_00545 [bacterium AB1]|nr:hypothetical protein AB837_00545 [bacterium AB1]